MSDETPPERTAIIGADGVLLRVVFASDIAGEDLTGCTTNACPPEYPATVDWDVPTQSWLAPPPPPAPPAPRFDQLTDILASGRFPTLAEAEALKLLTY